MFFAPVKIDSSFVSQYSFYENRLQLGHSLLCPKGESFHQFSKRKPISGAHPLALVWTHHDSHFCSNFIVGHNALLLIMHATLRLKIFLNLSSYLALLKISPQVPIP